MSGIGVTESPSLAALNGLPADRFVEAVGPLFERAPRFLGRLAAARPFASWEVFFEHSLRIALAMPEAEQLELVDSHPRLGSDPAAVRARSELSYREQGYDRCGSAAVPSESDTEPSASGAEFVRLRDAYEDAFGFRFVVFVAGRTRAALLPELRAAIEADRDTEIQRALADVVAIARDRKAKLGWL